MRKSKETRTNADKIRALPNEVLAQIIRRCCIGSACFDCPVEQLCDRIFRVEDDWFDWLESEAEEDADNV